MLEKPYEIDRTAHFNCRRGGDAWSLYFCVGGLWLLIYLAGWHK
ncbi:hypothetical protein PYR78_07775 [Acinetobacter johnsonii]|nr:hypothetical protein PYR78_07775 [Acinetobacter johnsonii]